jgi:hypothetical protein
MFKMADIFKMAFVLFSQMIRYFESIELIFGMSHYFLTSKNVSHKAARWSLS